MSGAAIALTPGEPAGIGPELVVQIAQRQWSRPLVAIADRALLETRAAATGLPLQLLPFRPGTLTAAPAGSLYHQQVAMPHMAQAGVLDPGNAGYVLDTLAHAVDGCLRGDYAGMVTAPVHKGVINDAGIPFSGHTEFIAARTGGQAVMMLACPGLRVALATTHLPLRDVADAIQPQGLSRVIRALHRDLKARFQIQEPNILVCGLNPHAGEGGHLGREEIEVIEPTLSGLRAEGIKLSAPLPADTLFTPRYLEQADAVLAMYHDQGLPVLKHMGFGRAVNITLGLPIVRTSVDHGTALQLAGSGRADSGSLIEAIEQALLLSA